MKLEDFVLDRRLERIDSVLCQRSSHLTVVLDHVHNEHNISAVIRSADAFGITSVHLVGETVRLSPGISLGAERWVEVQCHKNTSSLLDALDGFDLTLVEPAGKYSESIPIYELSYERPLALVFGNEHRGVSPELVEIAKTRIHIPMKGFVESLNISVAAAICLFWASVPNSTGEQRLPLLSEGKAATLRENWIKNSIREAEAVERELNKRKN